MAFYPDGARRFHEIPVPEINSRFSDFPEGAPPRAGEAMILLDTERTFPISLKADADLPDDKRPALLVRPLTCRQEGKYREFMKAAAEADKNGNVVEAIAAIKAGLEIVFRSTVNMLGVSSLDQFIDSVTSDELWEFATWVRKAGSIDPKPPAPSDSPAQ